jgi:hypothetical protein
VVSETNPLTIAADFLATREAPPSTEMLAALDVPSAGAGFRAMDPPDFL